MKDADDEEHTYFETRTPVFYAYLRSINEPEEEIIKFKKRMQKSPETDTLTDYFIHEIRNAFNVVTLIDPNREFPVQERAYVLAREKVMKTKQGLDWFTQEGPIPKPVIENFFATIESLGAWDAQLSNAVHAHFNSLIVAYEADELMFRHHQ